MAGLSTVDWLALVVPFAVVADATVVSGRSRVPGDR